MIPKFNIFFLAVGLLAFAALSIFGFGHINGMTANENGDMAGCIFTGKTMLCKMGVIEHISLWQGLLTSLPQENLILLALLIILAVVIFITKDIFTPPPLRRNRHLTKQPIFNYFKEAFSQGILNPRIYEPAVL